MLWWLERYNARKVGKSGDPRYRCNRMNFTRAFLLGPVFFHTALPCSGGYHLERGGMPLIDAVLINCKGVQLLKIKSQLSNSELSSIWAKGCMLMIVCVLSDLT